MTEIITFEQLPLAVDLLGKKLENIERILLGKRDQQSSEQSDQLLTIQQAAALLSLSVSTIYSKVSKGELPVMKRSKRLYFSRLELMEYLRQGRRKTLAEIESQELSDMVKTKKKTGHEK